MNEDKRWWSHEVNGHTEFYDSENWWSVMTDNFIGQFMGLIIFLVCVGLFLWACSFYTPVIPQ